MANIQDLRQSQSKNIALPNIGTAADAGLDIIASNIDKSLGQLRIQPTSTISSRVIITASDVTKALGNKVGETLNNLLVSFAGIQIDFGTGTVYQADGVTTIPASAFTPTTLTSGQYQWYSIHLIPSTVNADNTINLQLLVVPGSAPNTVFSSAQKAPFSSAGIPLGQVWVLWNGAPNIANIDWANIEQLGPGSGNGSGSGSGSGTGDDLDALQYNASFTDTFSDFPTASTSSINTSGTNAVYSVVNKAYAIKYDSTLQTHASNAWAIADSTHTHCYLAAGPSGAWLKVGDIVMFGVQARAITSIVSQTEFYTETFNPLPGTSVAIKVSQAVYTKDINNFPSDGDPISAIYTDSIADCLVTYNDTASGTVYNYADPALVGFTVSADNSAYSNITVREANLSLPSAMTNTPTSGTNLYLRFFANKSSGSGTVNLVGYKAFFHRAVQTESGGILNQAYCFTNSVGTPVNVSSISGAGVNTTIRTTFSFPVNVNSGQQTGSIKVMLDGKDIPRFINSTLTPDASYIEINANTIKLDRDYSSYNFSVSIQQWVAVVDSNTQNTTDIATINAILARKPTQTTLVSSVSATYYPPANATSLRVRVVGGGGGGGGGCNASGGAGGGGGGAGGYAEKLITSIASSYVYVTGGGGSQGGAGNPGGGNGANGSATTFVGTGVSITCAGGGGGGGAYSTAAGGYGGFGGGTSGGDLNNAGQPGCNGSSGIAGVIQGSGAAGGGGPLGSGGGGGSSNGAGGTGASYGGGGGGGSGNGGVGSGGAIIIDEYYV